MATKYYIKKIQELVNEKIWLFSREDVSPKQVTEREKSRCPTEKKKMQERTPIVSNQVTQRLKEFITTEINGKEAKVVIQKTLYATDLKKSQNRLSMPLNQVETHDFLTEEEKRVLKNKKGFEVELWGPSLQKHGESMVLKIWKMRSTDNYVLKTNWYKFVEANQDDLKENTMIQVWSFRRDEQLCFAIACLEGDDGQNDAAVAGSI